jgi:DNA repair exonuclease SbcCD ATPase subunit
MLTKENDDVKNNNAVSYIKSSGIFDDKKYKWIVPLVNKVLDDGLGSDDVRSTLTGEYEIIDETVSTIQKSVTYVVGKRNVKSMTEIVNVSNIGLLDINEPIKFENGLNIFYGKNGTGKSSIYLALCKIFGKNKSIYANLASDNENSACIIKYKNEKDEECELSWETNIENPDSSMMIFDGEIAQTLVESDQDNEFEIAHLKLEYFVRLHQLYEDSELVLNSALEKMQNQIKSTEDDLGEEIGFLFNIPTDTVRNILSDSITKEEVTTLEKTEKDITILGKNNPEAIVKNLSSVKDKIIEILQIFGDRDTETNEWNLRHSKEKISKLNERIKTFNLAKKTFEKGGKNKMAELIPNEWISDPMWNNFITKSIEFAKALDSTLEEKYTEENCLYCQQELATDKSKKLIEAYKEITSEHESTLQKEELDLQGIANIIESKYLNQLTSLQTKNDFIETEFSMINRTEKININVNSLVIIYTNIKDSINSLSEVEILEKNTADLSNFYNTYKELLPLFTSKITELQKSITGKDADLKSLEEIAKSLRQKSIIKKYKKPIENYSKNKEIEKELKEKISHLHTLKRLTSRLETDFSKIAGLKEFEECLEEEYKKLRFTPPTSWNLKPTTVGGVNKRAVRLDDKRLKDIFSEGERKLHALADFFAQCEVNHYNGLYIFDDPVNSLDEDNVELVASRISELADNGNQIIVFTHNLFFLNELVDASSKKINEVVKDNGKIFIETSVSKTDTSELKKNLKKIEGKMNTLSKESPADDIAIVYNYISVYLEYYVEQILFRDIVHRHRSNIAVSKLDKLNIDSDIVKNIRKLYRKTNRKSIRHAKTDGTQPPIYDELEEDVSYIKKYLKY